MNNHPICLGKKSKEMLMAMEEQPSSVKLVRRGTWGQPFALQLYILSVFFIEFCPLIKDVFLFINVDGIRAGGSGCSLGFTAKG